MNLVLKFLAFLFAFAVYCHSAKAAPAYHAQPGLVPVNDGFVVVQVIQLEGVPQLGVCPQIAQVSYGKNCFDKAEMSSWNGRPLETARPRQSLTPQGYLDIEFGIGTTTFVGFSSCFLGKVCLYYRIVR